MRIGICDDNLLFLTDMNRKLEIFMAEKGMPGRISCFSGLDELWEYLASEVLDLLFINVWVNGESGIEAVKVLNGRLPSCEIVYCSDSLEYATAVYETKHCYYLLKDTMPETLSKAMERAIAGLGSKERICVYSNGGNEMIPVRSFIYAERSGKKSYLYLSGGVQVETPERIEVIARKLAWPQFVRCHNSFIVSFDRMKTYTRHQLIMEDGREIPVSRPYLVRVRKAFCEWNARNL